MRVGSGPKVVVGFYGEGGVGFGLLQHSDHTLSEEPMEVGWKLWRRHSGVRIAVPHPPVCSWHAGQMRLKHFVPSRRGNTFCQSCYFHSAVN